MCAAVALATVGCAQENPAAGLGDYPDISLAQSKSPVQFLRNDAAGRVPSEVVDAQTSTEDESQACLPASEDVEGLIRSWQSSAFMPITPESSHKLEKIVDGLAKTFVDQGWKLATSGGNPLVNARNLSSDSSTAQIEIKATTDDPDANYSDGSIPEDVSVTIVVHGPCVVTDGEGSPEVLGLEKKDK